MNLTDGIQFDSFAAFIGMGGYAFNVWAVYALFALFVTVNLVAPLRQRKALLRDLRRRQTLNQRSAESTAGVAVDEANHKAERVET